jgi:transposase-like protein
MAKRKTFTKEFKAEAVRLLEQSGRPAADLARELGEWNKWGQSTIFDDVAFAPTP